MPTLTEQQITVYARAAGLPTPLFTKIAMAESSGRTDVVNSIGCVGLWQINQPVHVRDHPTWTTSWLKDPGNNARAAAVLYRQSGTAPWVSSRSKWGAGVGDVARALVAPGAAAAGAAGDVAGDLAGGIGAVASNVGRVADTVQRAGTWISTPANLLRIVYVVGGVALVLASVGQLVAVPAITRTAGRVIGGALKTKG